MSRRFLFTSESVSEGHPDKVCDQISDSVLDALIGADPKSRVACETLATTGLVVVAGEVTTKASADIDAIVRNTLRTIGYTDKSFGIDASTCEVRVTLDKQSPDIAQGVDDDPTKQKEQGAGDQGLMFGFATNETPDLMPLPIDLAHKLARTLAEKRRSNLTWLRPDGKSQVTVEYRDGRPARVDTIVISAQHAPDITQDAIKEAILREVIGTVVPPELLDANTKYHINPTGRFVIGGPEGDCGLTGRKIIVDTYGGAGRHGGGAFSGKDPSKVDRSAAYYGRYIAKNIVAAGVAAKAEVQLAYAIGVARPVSINVDTFGTGTISDEKLSNIVAELFDARPRSIIEQLDLLKPIYRSTAAYGHFGWNARGQSWERTDRAEAIRKAAEAAA